MLLCMLFVLNDISLYFYNENKAFESLNPLEYHRDAEKVKSDIRLTNQLHIG